MSTTIGNKIDQLHTLREQTRALEEQVKILKQQRDALELDLIDQMDASGIIRSTGNLATVAIAEITRPTVDDWDAFHDFIYRNKYFHLLERRPSVAGCNELLETQKRIPGVVPYTQRKLNIRSV